MKKKVLSAFFLFVLVSAAVYAKTYTITISKLSETQGTLEFYDGNMSINVPCYFSNTPLERGSTYTGYITHMATKTDSEYPDQLRAGIYIPYPGRQIFIHEGKSADWSTGCVVINRGSMIELWNYIYEDNPRNYDNQSGNTIHIVVN
jgi:hypothetical protein